MENSENIVGNLVNPIPLKVDVDLNDKFEEFVKNINASVLQSFINQIIPFDVIVAEINPKRTLIHNPIFQVPVVFQPPKPKLNRPWDVKLFDFHSNTSKFDLSFTFEEDREELNFVIEGYLKTSASPCPYRFRLW